MSKEKVNVEVEESSGNVFKDIGLPHPEECLVKAELAHQISQIIEGRGWTQAEAAKVLGIDQPKVSMILNGKLSEFSYERLIRFLRLLNCRVEIRIKPTRQRHPPVSVIGG